VFADATATTPAEVNANWEAIKTSERGGTSPLASVPLAAPALTLAATLQRKAARIDLSSDAGDAGAALAAYQSEPTAYTAGVVLWALVAAMRDAGIDAEAALRARARAYRDAADAQFAARDPKA
jgi:XTP/dITP diphosphohydrolase